MKRFFGQPMTAWPSMRNRLHVYVLPDDDLRSELAQRKRVLEAFSYCSIQPDEYLHATVQQFAVTSDEVTRGQVDAFTAELERLAASTASFSIDLSAPSADEWSLGVRGVATPAWISLVEGVRSAAASTINAGRALPPSPLRPHITLGYGVAKGSTQMIQSASDASGAGRLPPLRVEAVHFLAVHQDTEHGTFRWDETAGYPLRR